MKSVVGLRTSIVENELLDFTGLLGEGSSSLEDNVQKLSNLAKIAYSFWYYKK